MIKAMIKAFSFRLLFITILLGAGLNLSSCVKEVCDETCAWSGDGECDDGGEDSDFDHCDLGSDCLDCGTREIN
jgi:hypothetical protein